MATERDDADLNRNKEVVLRFMRLMDGAPVISMRSTRSWPRTFGSAWGSHLDRTQTKDFIRAVYAAFPDYTHTPEEILAVGDRVVLGTTNRATHSGDFQGIAPTGRRIHSADRDLSAGRWQDL